MTPPATPPTGPVAREVQTRVRAPAATVLISGAATGGRLAIIELTLTRGAELPRHRHHWEDEALYVLSGEVAVEVGDSWCRVPTGSAFLVARGVAHGIVVITPEARLLTVLTPAGFDGFYQELSGAVPDLERLVATAARYGCEITGPPPTRSIPLHIASELDTDISDGRARC